MNAGEAYVFINYDQAGGFGHIGWGFQLAQEQFYFGSTDHLWRKQYPLWHPLELLRYMHVRPGDSNDFWAESGSAPEMLATMSNGKHVRYQYYKVVPVENAQAEPATSHANSCAARGWSVLTDNCVHQTYRILCKYGSTALPDPDKATAPFLIPRIWFAEIKAQAISLLN